MRKFNLVKSLTRVMNTTSLPFRKGLGLGRIILCLSLAAFGVNDAWGAIGSHWYYGYAYAWPNTSSSGTSLAGGVYVSLNGNKASNDSDYKPYDSSSKKNTSALTKTKGTWMAKAYDGYYFVGWYKDSYSGSTLGSNTKYEIEESGEWTVYAYAKFAPVTISQASSPSSLSFNEPGENTLTITFDVVGADATSDFDYNVSGEGWSFNAWSYANNKITMTVKYTASVNTTNGTHSGTVTLTSKGTNNGLSSGTKSKKSVNISADVNLTPTFNVSTDEYDFGDATLNVDTKTMSLNLTNIKNVLSWDLNGLSIPFSASKNENVVTITFKPVTGVEVKSYSQTLTVKATSGNGQTKSVNIAISGNVISIKDPTFTSQLVNEYYVGDSDLDLSTLWTSDNKSGIISYSIISFVPTSGEQSGSVAPAITSNRYLSLNKAGTLQLKMSQSATTSFYAHEETKTITISRIANTLTADATHSMKVDETWNNVYSNKNSDGTITTTTSDETIAYYDVANNKIVTPNSSAKSFNSTEVTITISQEATYKYTAAEKTIKVTVNKHVPTFTWSNATLYHNQTYNDFFTTNCPNALSVKSSSDDGVAYLVDGTNAQKLNLKTLTKAASTTLTVTQAENYYWAEHTESKTITPTTVANHVPFTISKAMYDALNDGTAGAQSWDGGIKLGDLGDGLDWDDKYREFGPFNGIPDKLSCSYSCSDAASGKDWRIYQSADGSNWGSAIVSTSNAGSANNIQLAPTTRYLKFVYSGNFAGYFQNITVTELKTFSTDQSSLDFGTDYQKGSPHPTKKLSLNYANVGHHITLEIDNDNFTVEPTVITSIGGEKYGEFKDIVVEYSTEVVDTINATLTIKDELGNKAYVALSGGTHKKAQTLTWAPAYQAEHPTIPVGKPIENAASVYTGAQVTYTSSNPKIIEIINDGTAFKAVGAGSATITAYQAGDDEWQSVESSKEFITTYKQIQNIHWDQSFRKIIYNESTPAQTMGLTAAVYVVDPTTGEEKYSDTQTAKIQYISANTNVVSVSGTTLTINGVGETTLTAEIAGDEDYEGTYTSLPVRVRVPSIGCDDPLLVNYTNQIEFFAMHTGELTSDEIAIDRENGNPDKLSFWHEGKAWKLAIEYYKGSIKAQQKINGQWQDVQGSSVTPTKNQYNQLSNLQLDRNATHIRFVRPQGGQGYHHVKDIEVTLLKYIETETTTVDFGSITPGSKETRQITVNYSNIQGDVGMTVSNSAITIEGAIETECGGRGQQVITIQYAPTTVETLNDQLFFRDKVTNVSLAVNLTGSSVRNNQTITWNPSKTSILTTETIDLNATTSSGLPVSYSVTKGSDIVTINNGQVTILKDGEVTVEASQQGNPSYSPATSVSKDFTITKDNPIITWPTATEIIYGQSLNESLLTGGVAVDHNSTIVTGSFSWKNGSAQLTVGNQNQIVVFTPDNQNWYTQQETTIPVTIQKADPNATAQASEIIYGATVESSELTNTGTTEGTWTWTDEKKGQVLNVGTHEGLNVHFTPTDQTNYNEIDGTVSLTVKKATATLTWTNAPTSADVKDKLTYTATSNHSESTITYSIISGADCATIDANTGELTITKAGTITVQASQDASAHYEAATAITVTTTLTGKFENIFSGNGDWNTPENWSLGLVPTEENPDVVVSGEMTISEPISVGGLTIEQNGKVNIVNEGNLTVNGTSADRETYGNLFVRNGGNVTIGESANVRVFDFVVESSIGTSNGSSQSGQVANGDKVLYTNGAYIDINMDPSGKMDDTQWYGFTVPFPVDVQNGVARKEGDTFCKCTYGTDYMIAEYDMQQRLNTGKGWKYITTSQLQPGHFYYITVNGEYNTYSFKAADNTITIHNGTQLVVNGTGADANWNAVGNTTLTYATISGDNVPKYVQTYVNGQSCYQVVYTANAQFVVGCPFFFQAKQVATVVLNKPDTETTVHYAPQHKATKDNAPMCLRIAEDGKTFTDQMYLTASEEAQDYYQIGRDLVKAGVGTKSAQIWIDAYGQQLCVHDAALIGDNAVYNIGIYAPKNGDYEIGLAQTPTDGSLYLTQDGMIIWNLSKNDYPVSLSKGTTHEYGLLFRRNQPNAPTDIESMSKEQTVDKFIYQEHLYILKNGHLYNAAGATVKQNIRK